MSPLEAPDQQLLAALPDGAGPAHGVPTGEEAAVRERAAVLVRDALDDVLAPDGLRHSCLGPGWSRDLDAHVVRRPDGARLSALGWVPLDPLLAQVGSRARDRWAVVDGDEVVGALDLDLSPVPGPVDAVVGRARRRGEVRLREVLELRVLQRQGQVLPAGDPVVEAATALERALGGDELPGRADPAPDPVRPVAVQRPLVTGLRERIGAARRPRLVVALSGVDGAGKSTLVAGLSQDLQRAGVPHDVVWARPGMRLKLLDRVARVAKRLLGQRPEPGVRTVAAGEAEALPSRRGVVGAVWALAVTVAFLVDVWRRHLRSHGVVLYDRHHLDALTSLEFAYEGADLRLPRLLIRHGMPHARLGFHLDVPLEVAVARKPGDVIGEHAVRRQLQVYEHLLPQARIEVLDATRPAVVIRRHAFARLARAGHPG